MYICETFCSGYTMHSEQTTQPDEHIWKRGDNCGGGGWGGGGYRHLPLTRLYWTASTQTAAAGDKGKNGVGMWLD